MNKSWQIILVLGAIFATGAVSGGLVAFRIARHNAVRPPPPPDVWVARNIERAGRILDLTPEQRERVKPVVKSYIDELSKLRRPYLRSTHEILDRMESEIAAILTPEQKAKYEQLLQRQHELWRQVQEPRGMRGGRERPPGAPDAAPKPPPDAAPKATGT